MEFLLADWLGKPAWMWLAFMGVVVGLLALDLGVLHRGAKEIGVRESLLLSGMYITIGVAFGGWVWWEMGAQPGIEYLTGFAIEKSLAMDNVFVIAMIFGYLAIPRSLQHRVLFWGILGVIVLRAVMIGAGAALVSQFGWVLYLFAVFLILTGIRMFMADDGHGDMGESRLIRFIRRRFRVTDDLDGQRFFVRRPGRDGRMVWWATPMFLALVMIEVADVIFAVDSVPAIFAITTDPYIVYTSNIFAILGLRALYFALAAVIHRFAYLKQALAVLLIFIGGKVFVADLFGWTKFPAEWSLAITALILTAGVVWSLWRTREDPGRAA
ncbi:MAG: TerC family protein [Brevundimonas sp.]|uniref:TerC family protein n=1 Tax=Brevundimonas sp. TaxID=1871086 RepID=UPI002ABB95D7|nr:TerC family protein [Brevundimonas sp.]MDZ4110066.1 TerC family protein [Brevundimonas sp.]